MDSLSRGQLASRLTLNCLDSYVEPQKLKDVYITVMDVTNTSVSLFPMVLESLQVFDESALSQLVKEELYKCYPEAKRAHLKDGGNFPYLSRSTEVDLHLQVNYPTLHDDHLSTILLHHVSVLSSRFT